MGSRRHFSPLQKLAIAGTSFLLALAVFAVVGELVLRVIAPKSDGAHLGRPLENSARRYGLKPSFRSLQNGVLVETNSLGFREREYAIERTPRVGRIAVLGDSYALGVGVEFAQTFPKRLETLLNGAGGTYEVLNFGVSGYNTVLELATFRETAAKFRPDLVIVAYVLNDTERWTPSNEMQLDGTGRSPLTAVHLWLKPRSMLYLYLSPKVGTMFGWFNARYAVGATNQIIRSYEDGSLGWIESRQALLDIDREARRVGARTLVVVFPLMLDFATYPLGSAHDRITRFCREHDIDVLDLLPRFRHERASNLVVFLDGHPNALAHDVFAQEIFRYLSRDDSPLRRGPR